MKLIIKPRQSGKTSELIRMSEETNAYILTLNRGMAEYVSKMAEQQGYNILFPITLDEYMRSRLKGSHVTHILIDNADMVLQHIFSEATIDAITMSSEEPERFSSAWHKIYMRGDAISRQAVLEMAYDMSEIDGEHFTEPCMVVDVEDIQKLPSVNPQEPKWILVSERFPDIHNYSEKYLVTLKRGGVHIAMFTECDGKHWWSYDDVVAWMPLPEPYKAEKEIANDKTRIDE